MKHSAYVCAVMAAWLGSAAQNARAEEDPVSSLNTALATTLSGYVDTSAHWNPGTGNGNLPCYTPNVQPGTAKADGFNFNVISLTLNKAVGEGDWGAGYNAQLLFGPDAVAYNTSLNANSYSDFALKDVHVTLHAPVGNGVDVKIGTFTQFLGYEVFETGANPNYTRSFGYTLEPVQMTGVSAGYQLTPNLLASFAIADAWSSGINSRAFSPYGNAAESFKTYMGSVLLTAPEELGFLGGSTLLGGIANGYDSLFRVTKTSWYVGGVFKTPLDNVKVGLAHDYVNLGENSISGTGQQSGYQHATGLYLCWQATGKLSFNSRGEYLSQSSYLVGTAAGVGLPRKAFEVTETVQYDIWANVLTRLEFRWDHAADSSGPFSTGVDNANLVAANVIYSF